MRKPNVCNLLFQEIPENLHKMLNDINQQEEATSKLWFKSFHVKEVQFKCNHNKVRWEE